MLHIDRITHDLGGQAILGHAILSSWDLFNLVHQGIPAEAAEYVLETGTLTKHEFNRLISPERTYMRRLKEKKLSFEESDKLIRFARIRAFASSVLGEDKEADAWLREPNIMLHDARPLDMLDSDSGAQLVENLLGRIAHGIPS